ncbi:sigma 54-interacting transcriptional regulator [Candidatus Babeliales bacterium]|nr:sigma 54-interacting transcriptional regulator [Candidatus Babeliales bacterium]
MNIVFSYLEAFIFSQNMALALAVTSAALKLFLLAVIVFFREPNTHIRTAIRYAMLYLASSMFIDISWILPLYRNLASSPFPDSLNLFSDIIVKCAWILNSLLNVFLMFFVGNLLGKRFEVRRLHRGIVVVTSLICLPFVYDLFLNFYHFGPSQHWVYYWRVISIWYFLFTTFLIVFPFLAQLKKLKIPYLLQQQLGILLKYIILPAGIFEFACAYPTMFFPLIMLQQTLGFTMPALHNLLSLSVVIALYVVISRMRGLRFLNMREHVEAPVQVIFVDQFKVFLHQLGKITSLHDLSALVRTFVNEAFDIDTQYVHFIERPYGALNEAEGRLKPSSQMKYTVEHFLRAVQSKEAISNYLSSKKILITDELAFDQIYADEDLYQVFLKFLDSLNAAVFLPIYYNDTLMAYIVIERGARPRQAFYNNVERDEMLILASYLGNILHLLQTRSIEAVEVQERKLQEVLYAQERGFEFCHESLRAKLHETKRRKEGLVFYSEGKFILGNTDAQQLVSINLNTQDAHPLAVACKKVVQFVELYKTMSFAEAENGEGKSIKITGFPDSSRKEVVLTLREQGIGQKVLIQSEQFQDRHDWLSLLHLHGTKTGQRLNEIIPLFSLPLLKFKVSFMRKMIEHRALFLLGAQDDCKVLADLVHTASSAGCAYYLNPGDRDEASIAEELFGLDPVVTVGKPRMALLERAGSDGTIIIHDVHKLSMTLQNQLAEYLKYGWYRLYKSEQKRIGLAQIVVASDKDIEKLVLSGYFSKTLYEELKGAQVYIPDPLSLEHAVLSSIMDAYIQQEAHALPYKRSVVLNEAEKIRFIAEKPIGFVQLRKTVQEYIHAKSRKRTGLFEVAFDNASMPDKEQLQAAARLGKQALKNQHVMQLLWDTFKNQNKIAEFIGVNRSSVSRRCKVYQLH